MTLLLPDCLCGHSLTQPEVIHGIAVGRCRCGIVRQEVHSAPHELGEWYRTKYFGGVYTHSYTHDRHVAGLRLEAYHLPVGAKILDVGSGHGAFVHEARARGYDAWGQDVADHPEDPYIYDDETLEGVAFPTESFDVVTVHDVLEHFIDPYGALLEMKRVLKPGGKLIIDFPRFWVDEGRHHWKPVEHLWMLTEEQLSALTARAGFAAQRLEHPIPSKVVLEVIRPAEKRPTIFMPAGIGDTYWCLVKLPGFLREQGLGMPDVWVQANGPKRTVPFLETIPFIHAAGYLEVPRHYQYVWHELYMKDGRTVVKDPFPGFPVDGPKQDWFIAYNGVMRYGKSLQDVDPSFGCDWYPRMHRSKVTRAYARRLQDAGPYLVVYLVDSGMYQRWWAEVGPGTIYEALQRVRKELGFRIVFVGAEWDKGSHGHIMAQTETASDWVNLVAQTSYEELAGVLQGASCIFGWPSGATLLGPVWNVPTFLVWNQYFRSAFWRNSAPPASTYRVADSRGLTVDVIVNSIREMAWKR